MSYHFHSSLYRITKAVRFQPCHLQVSKKRLSYFLAAFSQNHWKLACLCTIEGGGSYSAPRPASYRMWRVRQGCEYPPLTHIQSNARRFLFLLSAYLLVAEAASFDKKELCRSDTNPLLCYRIWHNSSFAFIHHDKRSLTCRSDAIICRLDLSRINSLTHSRL